MSRANYKGSKIEWDVDECNQPLEAINKALSVKSQRPVEIAKSAVQVTNRFATLRVDDDDNDSDDKFDTSSQI
ncbi:hypothetical protein BX600DRAFT_515632 [Xylariales sp. PMI_506]|nr:hypothetical protein BX600DRAFT_515632 [Xylariales sp. PMI_506]